MSLKLADGLKLPAAEAVTQKYGFIGRSGSGKSYAAMRLAELFLESGAQIIALDWVGIWWSLRIAARTDPPYESKGGGFLGAVSKLRTLGLIEGRGELRASDDLCC